MEGSPKVEVATSTSSPLSETSPRYYAARGGWPGMRPRHRTLPLVFPTPPSQLLRCASARGTVPTVNLQLLVPSCCVADTAASYSPSAAQPAALESLVVGGWETFTTQGSLDVRVQVPGVR